MSDDPSFLDDPAALARIDVHGTRAILLGFPAQCRAAAALRPEPDLGIRPPRVVVMAGMGGSAVGGDLVAACATARVPTAIVVHRDYGLPEVDPADTLVVASSYSGETVEVLSAVEAALAAKVPVAVVTSGGTLARLARARSLPLVALPGDLMPRMALGHLLFAALAVLTRAGVAAASVTDIEEALEVVARLGPETDPACPTSGNEAKRLALAIGDRLPAIYGGPLTGRVANRWKTDLEENAKVFALAGALPEMNHNEIEAWSGARAAGMHLVSLRDPHEAPEIARRFEILEALARPHAGGMSQVQARGEGRLARLLSLAALGQWTSFYLAMLRGVDPWPVPVLEETKRRLTSAP